MFDVDTRDALELPIRSNNVPTRETVIRPRYTEMTRIAVYNFDVISSNAV